jgi:gamma-glutamyltranspeptidase/glutathione hydrolase
MKAMKGKVAVCSPHHLASEAGAEILREGGNAVDAAIATNLALAVVVPYCCGAGGDLFAMVWDGVLNGYASAGRSPVGATVDRVRERSKLDFMPYLGPHSVTVPGAVPGWFELLESYGTMSFDDVVQPARRLAADGFVMSDRGAETFNQLRMIYQRYPEHAALYGEITPGMTFVQPGYADLFDELAEHGVESYRSGRVGHAIAASVARHDGFLTMADLAAHETAWVEPLRAPYRNYEIVEMPPPTQGVNALEIMRILDGDDLPDEDVPRLHLMIEATKLALSDRDQFVTDPAAMDIDPRALLSDEYVASRRAAIDPTRASSPLPGVPQVGGTAYFCVADANGMLVSIIQSNFLAFGSGLTVPEFGFGLHNRGSSFTFDPTRVNVLAPAKLPMHTLIPAMVLREGVPDIVFGAMGGDGQAQTHAQFLARALDDGMDLQEAMDAPRFKIDPGTWKVRFESRVPNATIDALRRLGHDIVVQEAYDDGMGHGHAISVEHKGYLAASDIRAEGAAVVR